MILEYYLIQYVSDPFRNEGRNVALIGTCQGKGYLRAIGLASDGSVDRLPFCSIAGLSRDQSSIWPEWIHYLEAVTAVEGRAGRSLALEMTRLSERDLHFVSGGQGSASMEEGMSPDKAMDELFDRLIGDVPANPDDLFFERLEFVFHCAEVSYRQDFWESIEIDIEKGDEFVTISLDAALVTGKTAGFCIVRSADGAIKAKQGLKAAISNLQKAVDVGFLTKRTSIILTDSTWNPDSAISRMAQGITVININDADAPSRIHAAIHYS